MKVINKFFAIVVFISICIILFLFYLECFYPLKFKKEIEYYSNLNNLNKEFVASVICAESRFNPKAISNKNAIGLMQLVSRTAKSFSYDDNFENDLLFIPQYNIMVGCNYLKYLFDKYNDEIMVLACYNAGETVALKWRGNEKHLNCNNITYSETKNYIAKILRNKKIYKYRF